MFGWGQQAMGEEEEEGHNAADLTCPQSGGKDEVEDEESQGRRRAPLSLLPMRSREKRPMDNRFFYDPAMFPALGHLAQHTGTILAELMAALGCAIVAPQAENGAKLSGVWCEDKRFQDFYLRNKDQKVCRTL